MCVFVATLAEILSTVKVTFDEEVVSRVHVIIHLASFHYTYRFLFLCRKSRRIKIKLYVYFCQWMPLMISSFESLHF